MLILTLTLLAMLVVQTIWHVQERADHKVTQQVLKEAKERLCKLEERQREEQAKRLQKAMQLRYRNGAQWD